MIQKSDFCALNMLPLPYVAVCVERNEKCFCGWKIIYNALKKLCIQYSWKIVEYDECAVAENKIAQEEGIKKLFFFSNSFRLGFINTFFLCSAFPDQQRYTHTHTYTLINLTNKRKESFKLHAIHFLITELSHLIQVNEKVSLCLSRVLPPEQRRKSFKTLLAAA